MSDKKLNNTNYTIKVKSWLKANINSDTTKAQATQWELHFCTDTKELYIFDWTENVKVTSNSFETLYQNIKWYDGVAPTVDWDGRIATKWYDLWGGESITFTFAYNADWTVDTVTLSWDVPAWVKTVKKFNYTADWYVYPTYT